MVAHLSLLLDAVVASDICSSASSSLVGYGGCLIQSAPLSSIPGIKIVLSCVALDASILGIKPCATLATLK